MSWLAVGVLGSFVVLPACSQHRGFDDHGGVVTRGPAPRYIDAVADYNAARPKIDKLRVPGVVRITYADDEGEVHNEQGDGLLQVIPPDRVALSLRKVGTPILWLGCDDTRSWFFDLISDEPTALVRSNDAIDRDHGSMLGLAIRPSDLLVMLGLTPIDIHAEGGTQWSADGRRLGITTRLNERTLLRLWIDPHDQRPVKAEWFDEAHQPLLVAEMTGTERVEFSGAGERPIIPARISASHVPTGAFIRLDLSSAQSGRFARIADDAFRFEALCEYLGVQKVIEADR